MAKGSARNYQEELDKLIILSKTYLAERHKLKAIVNPTVKELDRIEELREKINNCRKNERFLRTRLKTIRGE